MTKKISQLAPSVSLDLNEASLLEVAIQDADPAFPTGFKSASVSIGELRKVLNASSVEQRVDINVDTTVNMSTNNQNIQIAVSKAFIPWDEAITDKFISVLLARFNVSGSAESSSLTLPLFSDMSVAYYASSTEKRVKYKTGYYMHSSQENGIHLAGVEPSIDISDDSISLYVSNVAETEDNIIFTVRLLKNYRPTVNPSDNYQVFFGPVRVKFRGYVDISASYEDKPSYLRLTSVPDGSISIQGFPVGSEINWGDGNTTAVSNSSQIYTHYYDSGTYVAEVILYDNISGGNDPLVVSGNFDKIINWGSFYYNRPITFTSPDLVEVPTTEPPLSNYSSLFRDCTNFNQNINTWNTSPVVNMSNTFYGCVNFNQPLDNWDVSNVSNFTGMFADCSNFDQNINTWNTSMAVEMANMFSGCTSFNQHLNNWDMSNVTTVAFMLAGCTSFNKPLNNWVLSNVTNVSGMFIDAQTFNSNISGWNMENVTLMSYMFDGATSFNGAISNWNVSNVINMDNMFHNASMFNQDLSNWCVFGISVEPYQFSTGSPLTTVNKPVWGDCPEDGSFKFYYEFGGAVVRGFPEGSLLEWPNGTSTTVTNANTIYESPASTEGIAKVSISNSMPYAPVVMVAGNLTKILSWGDFQGSQFSVLPPAFVELPTTKLTNVPSNLPPSITSLESLFLGAEYFNDPNVKLWDVSNVTNMNSTFRKATAFDQDISGWNVTNVGNMTHMFRDAKSFNRDLSLWCVNQFATEPTSFSLGADLWSQPKPVWGTCPAHDAMIFSAKNHNTVTLEKFPNGTIVDWGDGKPRSTLSGGDPITHYYNVTGGAPTYVGRIFLPNGAIYMSGCHLTGTGLVSLNSWGNFAGDNITFKYSSIEEAPVDFPSSITTMEDMFFGCAQFNSWNIRFWDTINVTNMRRTFRDAAIFNGALGLWDTSSVGNMEEMFRGCAVFNQPLESWNVEKLTNATEMFNGCVIFDQPLESWNTDSLTDADGMFRDCTSFNQDLSSWCVRNILTLPTDFATGADSWVLPKPIWGTCPAFTFSKLDGGEVTISGFPSGTTVIAPNGSTFGPTLNNTTDIILNGTAGVGVATIYIGNDGPYNPTNVSVHGSALGEVLTWSTFNHNKISFLYSNRLSSVPNILPTSITDTSSMFYGCYSFTGTGTRYWNTENVTNMAEMFGECASLSIVELLWDTSNVTTMERMFIGSTFNGDISTWDTSNVTDMSNMFSFAVNFNQDVSDWDVGNVTNMGGMFANATSFNADISNWNVENVTSMMNMFSRASTFDQNISEWNVSNVVNMNGMFSEATTFNQNLTDWCVAQFPTTPLNFDFDATSWVLPKPNWGAICSEIQPTEPPEEDQ